MYSCVPQMFVGFKEGMINFAPTHKYEPGTQKFVQDIPKYADRILWRRKVASGSDCKYFGVYDILNSLDMYVVYVVLGTVLMR